MITLTVANQKGGVGKTTTVINLAAAMAADGLRVLVVDMDFQANTTTAMLAPAHLERTIAHVLVDACPLADILRPSTSPGVVLAPAGPELVRADLTLASKLGRESRLANALKPHRDEFDVALVDTSPYLGLLTVNGLVAASHVLVPVSAEYFSMLGLKLLGETIEEVRSQMGTSLTVAGYLITEYDRRLAMTDEVVTQLSTRYGTALCRTRIRTNANLKAAPAHHQDILQYEASCPAPRKGLEDYTALSKELQKRLGLKARRRASAA